MTNAHGVVTIQEDVCLDIGNHTTYYLISFSFLIWYLYGSFLKNGLLKPLDQDDSSLHSIYGFDCNIWWIIELGKWHHIWIFFFHSSFHWLMIMPPKHVSFLWHELFVGVHQLLLCYRHLFTSMIHAFVFLLLLGCFYLIL